MINTPFQSASDANVVDSFWFNYIGIVKVKSANGEHKYYIGQGKGENQHEDEQYLAKNGTPVSPQALSIFLGLR